MTNVLSIENLTKTFGKTNAVENVSLNVPTGSIYGLIGENGAGKTTIMKTVVGLIKQTKGSFTLFESDDILAGRKKIGCVIENPAIYPNMTAKSNLITFAKMMGLKDANAIDDILNTIGLADVKKKAKNFSLGMKQRLSIGIALLNDPDFLILDEPINGLDPTGIAEIRNLLLDLNKRGKTILISSHILSELFKVATNYGIIHKGKLVGEYTEEQLTTLTTSALRIVVDDEKKALEIIEKEFGIKARYDSLERCILVSAGNSADPADINAALCRNGIRVSELVMKKDDLESFVIGLMQGGEENVKTA